MRAAAAQQVVHALPCGGHLALRVVPAAPGAPAATPGVVFLHGLLSTATGAKALALEAHALARGHAYLGFDARGHGASSGAFRDMHLGHWLDDARAALDAAPAARHVLVGSSFGGWQALLLAAERPRDVAGVVLVAPAADITASFWEALGPEGQAAARRDGETALGSSYLDGGAVTVGLEFFEAAKPFLVMHRLRELRVRCPLRILHGVRDDVVPVATSQRLFDELPVADATLTLVKDGDHRLSRPHDLALLLSTVEGLLAHAAGGSS
ncbi:Abhd10 [Scenedesmus sp. PABB004]|nr:Abhd10 [Scenedesmus sp. PABB004]